MPHVKFNTLDAGPKGVRHAGSVHDVTPEEAKTLIAGKFAAPCDQAGKPLIEKADANPKVEKRG